MTYIEKLRAEHPEAIAPSYMGGACGCPMTYGYENGQPCEEKRDNMMAVFAEDCKKCWNREMKSGA